jgi:Ni/Co efflux regulator RcnB
MTRKSLVNTVLAATMAVASIGAAFAQDRDGRGDRGGSDRARTEQPMPQGQPSDNRGRPDWRNGRPGDPGDARRSGDRPGRGDDRASRRDGRDAYRTYDARRGWSDGQRRYGRGAGPDHAYYPGQRLPYAYRNRSYVVDNWRAHRLSAPPRGYHWVQSGADYLLVAITTGVILQLLLDN